MLSTESLATGGGRPRGFSMVEFAVTLAVLGLLLMAIGPDVALWLRNVEIRNAAEAMQNGLQRARSEAVRRNQNVSFWLVSTDDGGSLGRDCALSATGRGWVVSVNDPAGRCDAAVSNADDPMIADKWAAGRADALLRVAATADDENTAASCLTFNGFGRVADAGCSATPLASITVDNRQGGADYRPLRIEITNGGNVRMCDTRAAADDPRKCAVQ